MEPVRCVTRQGGGPLTHGFIGGKPAGAKACTQSACAGKKSRLRGRGRQVTNDLFTQSDTATTASRLIRGEGRGIAGTRQDRPGPSSHLKQSPPGPNGLSGRAEPAGRDAGHLWATSDGTDNIHVIVV
ncbi:hypothetical protein Bbelb_356890 [Branchiostoma belcheri]|nr:hypothetical protein Bbelb_356890 [Branchiostoma belcheri]